MSMVQSNHNNYSLNSFERLLKYYEKEAPYKQCIKSYLHDRSFTDEELQQINSLYDPYNQWGIIWRLFTQTGMRPIEMAQLHMEGFDFINNLLTYKVCKYTKKKQADGSFLRIYKVRTAPICSTLMKDIKNYMECNKHRFKYGFIFAHQDRTKYHMHKRSINNEFLKIRKKLGGKFLVRDNNNIHLLTPKSFRITYITRMVHRLGIEKTSKDIQHNDPRVTMRYVAPTDLKEIKEVKSQLFPTLVHCHVLHGSQTTLI